MPRMHDLQDQYAEPSEQTAVRTLVHANALLDTLHQDSLTGSSPLLTPPESGSSSAARSGDRKTTFSRAELKAMTDQELLDGLRASNEAHFNELYDRYFQRIYNFVYTRIRDHADTEEVVQETFVAVFRSFDNYRGQSALLSWIYGIAKNTVNNTLRRSRIQSTRLQSVDPEMLQPLPSFATQSPEEQLDLRRYTEAISQRLGKLGDWQTEIFVMRHLDNLSIKEICEKTDRSSDAIRSSLYRVKRLLVESAECNPPPAI